MSAIDAFILRPILFACVIVIAIAGPIWKLSYFIPALGDFVTKHIGRAKLFVIFYMCTIYAMLYLFVAVLVDILARGRL